MSNNSSDLFDLTMGNIMDNFYDSAMNTSTDGAFKAVCISGVRTEDNQGSGTDPNDGLIVDGYMTIVVRPLTDFGDILPDPKDFSNPEEINSAISLHTSTFVARSDYEFKDHQPISFGQIVNCYFERGSIVNSDFRTLRFSEPHATEIELSYQQLSTVDGVSTVITADWASAVQLGPDGIDPRYPPRTATYVGTNTAFNGQTVENGNFPQELLATSTNGRERPTMLAEILPKYDQMFAAFSQRFPGHQLAGSGYRPYKNQLDVRMRKPNLAARPGTSNHGWGLAIDIGYYDPSGNRKSLSYSGEHYRWLNANAPRFGWVNPQWARQGSKKEEPWHWEWSNKNSVIRGIK